MTRSSLFIEWYKMVKWREASIQQLNAWLRSTLVSNTILSLEIKEKTDAIYSIDPIDAVFFIISFTNGHVATFVRYTLWASDSSEPGMLL